MIKQCLFFIGSVSLFTSCLQSIELDPPETPNGQLVVEGSFSDVFLPRVRLSFASDVSGNTSATQVRGANVEIRQSDGSTYILEEVSDGLYSIADFSFAAQENIEYQLFIALSDGRTYESDPQTLPTPIDILDSEALFTEEETIDDEGEPVINEGHNLNLTLAKEGDQFFIMETTAFTQVFVGYDDCGFFQPPAAGPTSCYQQRSPIEPNQIVIGTTREVNDDLIFRAARVPFDVRGKYVALLYVQAMSAANYDYWTQVSEQLNRPGGLFDTPFAPILGNINPVNHNQAALGYFQLYRTSLEIVCFDRTNIIGTFETPVIACPDLCTNFWAPATFQDAFEILCNGS